MMKKITLLLMLVSVSISLNAQIWDFANDNGGWEGKAGGTLTEGATASNFAWVTDEKPKMFQTTANVNADVNKIFSITIKNNTEITELKLKHLKPDTLSRFVKFSIDANLDEFKTYYFDLTNSNWVGTQNEIDFIFSIGGDNTTSDASMEVDQIGFIESIPTTEKNNYTFETDDDTEGWDKANGTIVGVTGGILTFTPTANKFAKLEQLSHYINADNNSSFHITLINESTDDDELRVIVGSENVTIPISTSDTEEKTYDIDLSGLTDWTGNVDGVTIAFRDADNIEGAGKSSGTGNFLIQSIIFDNQAVLAVDDIDFKDDVNISLYPNPASLILSIHSPKVINKVEVFNYLGQRTISKIDSLKTLNISGLTSGVYILKIYQEGNIVSTKRFIKE